MDPRFSNETLTFLQIMAHHPPPQGNTFDVGTMRQQTEDLHRLTNEELNAAFKGTTEEKTVKTNSAEIPITIYTPTEVNKDKLGIYFHGGGWVVGSRKSHQTIVNTLAEATKTVWISVEYRLGPEYKYPIWLDDASEVTQHIIQNKTDYGVNETAKIGVAGDSAGGMISASISHTIKGIDFQILIYALLDLTCKTASYNEFNHQMYFLTPEWIDWCVANSYENVEVLKDPRVSSLLNTSFQDLPPCLFIIADLDVLRDENLEYQKLLEKAGVQTKLLLVKGAIHGYFSLPGIFSQACAESVNAVRDFMASI